MFILSIFILSTVHLDKANGIGSEEKENFAKIYLFFKISFEKETACTVEGPFAHSAVLYIGITLEKLINFCRSKSLKKFLLE